MQIWLKAGEKIYINGAVLQVDRKVRIEFLNNVTFLLEAHVLQQEQATTPLRQMYFLVQSLLMDPANAERLLPVLAKLLQMITISLHNKEILEGVTSVARFVSEERYFDGLKVLRGLFPLEDALEGAPKAVCAEENEPPAFALLG